MSHGVMVAQQILVLLVKVRIFMRQLKQLKLYLVLIVLLFILLILMF